MAGDDRATTTPLIEELLRTPRQFSFFQAVRLLEAYSGQSARIGRNGPVPKEPIRFRPHASLAFASSDVERVEIMKDDEDGDMLFRMTVNFIGLYGTVSPLPVFYTEELIEGNIEESSRRDFFDLFHHRIISLFYRSWEKYRYFLQYKTGGTDPFSQWMYSLVGVGGRQQREGLSIDWERLLSYIGLVSMKSRSGATLSRIVAHYFGGVPVYVEQCIERQVVIEEAQRFSLGVRNCVLAENSTLGGTVRDIIGKFRIRIGPLSFDEINTFFPDGKKFRALTELVRFSLKDQLDFDVKLVWKKNDMPRLILGENKCQLGWSSWLGEHTGEEASVILQVPSGV